MSKYIQLHSTTALDSFFYFFTVCLVVASVSGFQKYINKDVSDSTLSNIWKSQEAYGLGRWLSKEKQANQWSYSP